MTATHKLTLKQRGRVPDPQKLGDKQKGCHKRAQAEIAAYEEKHSDVLDRSFILRGKMIKKINYIQCLVKDKS